MITFARVLAGRVSYTSARRFSGLPQHLEEVLVCPYSKKPLTHCAPNPAHHAPSVEAVLLSPVGLQYVVTDDGIPNMMIDDALALAKQASSQAQQ